MIQEKLLSLKFGGRGDVFNERPLSAIGGAKMDSGKQTREQLKHISLTHSQHQWCSLFAVLPSGACCLWLFPPTSFDTNAKVVPCIRFGRNSLSLCIISLTFPTGHIQIYISLIYRCQIILHVFFCLKMICLIRKHLKSVRESMLPVKLIIVCLDLRLI